MSLAALLIGSSSVIMSTIAIKWGEFISEVACGVAWLVGMPDAGGVVRWREIERVVVVQWNWRVVQLVVVPIWGAAAWVVTPPANCEVSDVATRSWNLCTRESLLLTTNLAGYWLHSSARVKHNAGQHRLVELQCSPSLEVHRSIGQPSCHERLLEGTTCSLPHRPEHWGDGWWPRGRRRLRWKQHGPRRGSGCVLLSVSWMKSSSAAAFLLNGLTVNGISTNLCSHWSTAVATCTSQPQPTHQIVRSGLLPGCRAQG